MTYLVHILIAAAAVALMVGLVFAFAGVMHAIAAALGGAA